MSKGWLRLVTGGVIPGADLMSAGDRARGWLNVGAVVGGGCGRLESLRVKLYVTTLPTDPALSVAKTSIVFVPLVV